MALLTSSGLVDEDIKGPLKLLLQAQCRKPCLESPCENRKKLRKPNLCGRQHTAPHPKSSVHFHNKSPNLTDTNNALFQHIISLLEGN